MTCLDLITRAYRLGGALRDIDEALSPADAAAGLAELESLVATLPGSRHWTDVDIDDDYTAGENERISNTSASSATITLPVTVASTSTVLYCCDQVQVVCQGYDDRIVRDGARVQVAGSAPQTFRYRADLGDWVAADSLTLTGQVPLNADMHTYLAAMLGVVLATLEGQQPPPATVGLASAGAAAMRARYAKRQAVAVEKALINTSSNGWRADA